MENIKKKIRDYWNNRPCCSGLSKAVWGTKEFFEHVDLYKDAYEPFTDKIAGYPKWKNKKVLEIGVGLGKDFSRFCANGAFSTGIDLTAESLDLTKKRLEIFGLKGNLCLADAENLPFKDNVFNLIFSWGVLHHTPDTQKAVDQVYRCLKPGGEAIVMLYNKFSFSFLEIMLQYYYHRVKKHLFNWGCGPDKTNRVLTDLNRDEFLASATDGAGNPLTKVYSNPQVLKIFQKFREVDTRAYQNGLSSFLRICLMDRYFGWFMVIRAKK